MASKNYVIYFRSLRSGIDYALSIGGGSGTAIELKGGSEPFSTQENDDEDQFTPVRTQSGHIRIVDDGLDANGNAFNWRDLAPNNDTERPVTLTHVEGSTTVVDWQGFMQAQNFGGTLYGNPQEREFPVQCCLSVLAATQVSTSEAGLCNFAYLLRYIFNSVPSHSFSSYHFQGGTHAQQWLLKRLDWHNFLNDNADNDVEPKYNLYEILEDVCRFWGWTCRQHRTSIYFTCADDTAETYFLTLTPTNLSTMAGGSTAGTTNTGYSTTTISGDVFASTDNDDFKQRGPGKATVKADCNKNETVLEFAPASVRKAMEQAGGNTWTWVQGSGDLVGWYETGHIGGTGNNACLLSFDSPLLAGSAQSGKSGFARRQVYTSKEQDKPQECDMFLFNHYYNGTAVVSLRSKLKMSFSGGSIKLKGEVYFGDHLCDWDHTRLYVHVGIGPNADGSNARWYYCQSMIASTDPSLPNGWSQPGTVTEFACDANNGQIKSIKVIARGVTYFDHDWTDITYDRIPVPQSADFYGYLFVEFLGLVGKDEYPQDIANIFQIANFGVEFSRDSLEIPTDLNVIRQREIKVERVSTQEYTSENQNQTHIEWNADCIFASDNNMEYGYGLLMNSDGTFMETAPYAASDQHPEQQLANRVTNYWAVSRRRLGCDFRKNTIAQVTPQYKVTIDGTTFHPTAISHDWRNEVVTLSLLEMPG